MGVFFTESRALPREFSRQDMGAYGAGQGWIDIFTAPTDFFKSWLVDKPKQERDAQVALQESQAKAAIAMNEQNTTLLGIRQKTLRTVVIVGAGIAAVLAVGLIFVKMRKKPAAKVAGYRRRAHKRSRR